MLVLALSYNKGNCSIKQIAEKQDLSESYLEQLVALLKKSKLVKSTRGASGGYALMKDPKDITVGDVLRALEGSLDPVDCALVNEEKECEDIDCCVTKYVWKQISDSINEVVNNITLQDMVDDYNKIKERE